MKDQPDATVEPESLGATSKEDRHITYRLRGSSRHNLTHVKHQKQNQKQTSWHTESEVQNIMQWFARKKQAPHSSIPAHVHKILDFISTDHVEDEQVTVVGQMLPSNRFGPTAVISMHAL